MYRGVEYCFKMPIRQAWEQTIEALFHFILFCSGMLYMPKPVAELGEWEEISLVKVNLEQRKHQKLHVCYTGSFFRDQANQFPWNMRITQMQKIFLTSSPPQRFFIVCLFLHFFCQSAWGKRRLLVARDLHSLCLVNTAWALRAKLDPACSLFFCPVFQPWNLRGSYCRFLLRISSKWRL